MHSAIQWLRDNRMRKLCLSGSAAILSSSFAVLILVAVARGQTPAADDNSARQVMAAMRTTEGMTVTLYAASPQVESPLALAVDERGRLLVAEVHRFNRGTEENRTRPFLLDDDLRLRTVDERWAMFEKWSDRFDGGVDWFTRYADKVRRLRDVDGDGKADESTEYARFGDRLDGLAAGVLTRDGDTFVTCIPNLWRLRDNDEDGVAEERTVLLSGFGVNASFLGHDLHGLAWGPDGRLYFSVGDRGYHVTTKENRVFSGPGTGAVFRCDPDGANFEVVHRGLRNPQEIAFDRFGNLFAADNNCDHGDHSRLVMIVEGGDSGWNMAFQTMEEPYVTGPWHAEHMWRVPPAEQPAWVVPPVGPIGAGPSGFASYPGVGFPARYDDHFFYCNYTESDGVESFAVTPRGAGFEIIDQHDLLKPVSATDIEFGYDGKLYVADYVKLDWSGQSLGGRVYTLAHDASRARPEATDLSRLLGSGFRAATSEQLIAGLGHPDHRLRLRAQWELVRRRDLAALLRAARSPSEQERLHAVWGLGQLARGEPPIANHLLPSLNDASQHVRLWAARLLGETGNGAFSPALLALLGDSSPSVQMATAIALGRLASQDAAEPIVQTVASNDDRDPWLRHGLVMGLIGTASHDTLMSLSNDVRPSVRRAALLAMRRRADTGVAAFLSDSDLALVTEAARTIHDLPLEGELPSLAAWGERVAAASGPLPDALVRRVLSANQRLGGAARVHLVTEIAANSNQSLAVRREALATLRCWIDGVDRDRVIGYWRPYPKHPRAEVVDALERRLVAWLGRLDPELLPEAIDVARSLEIPFDETELAGWARDVERTDDVRAAALRLLVAGKQPSGPELARSFLIDDSPTLRMAAREVLSQLDAELAVASAGTVLADDGMTATERQHALRLLGADPHGQGLPLLRAWGSRLARGQVPAELELDLIDVLQRQDDLALRDAARRFDESLQGNEPFQQFRICLSGGDPEKGRALFVGHIAAQCVRCHKVESMGGDAGPDLTRIASRISREGLLESLLSPDAKIAAGYGVVTLTLDDGRLLVGTVVEEDAARVILRSESGEVREVRADAIESRAAPRSAMPAMRDMLTRRELRDLVAFLSELR